MYQPQILIIAALAESNRVIGKNGKLPWKIPEDSQRFQRLTLNHTVVIGRRTWEFDIEQCPLVRRRNIVITSSPTPPKARESGAGAPFELVFVNSLQAALKQAADQQKIFIAGGASLYREALHVADTLELTLVEGNFDGDTFFPEYESLIGQSFELTKRDPRPGYRFETYQRILPRSI